MDGRTFVKINFIKIDFYMKKRLERFRFLKNWKKVLDGKFEGL